MTEETAAEAKERLLDECAADIAAELGSATVTAAHRIMAETVMIGAVLDALEADADG